MQNPYISLLSTAWRYARQQKKRYLLVYGMFVMANVVLALHPLLYGWFVESVQKDSDAVLRNVWWYAGAYIGLTLLEWAFHGPARVMERKLAFDLSKNFLDELYHQSLHLPIRWHQDHHSGATINRIRKAYEALKDFFQNGFMFLHAFSKFVFSFVAIVYFSPLFGSIGVLIGILTVWVIFKFDKPFIKALDETNEKEHIVSSTLFDSLSNIITVITLRLEKRMESSLMSKVLDVFPPFRKTVLINEWKWFVASLFIGLIYVVVTIGYIYQNYAPGTIFLVGGLVTLLGYVNQFTSVFQDVAWQYTEIIRYNTEVQTARVIGQAYHDQHRPESTNALSENWEIITIKNISFSHSETYDENKKAHSLHGLNLRIRRGERIAFIGESGSGKSTLLALLRGLYDAEKGAIVNVDDTGNLPLDTLAEAVTLFPQDPEIFENTIEYNITLGLPFDTRDINEVCKTTQFASVLEKLPKGLESNIQEKGVNLSGGQKQRLALARGVLAARSSQIVLLDEPTSSVDPKTEAMIYDNMFEEFKDKAVLSALHRLHLLPKFDYIYILKDGRIIDEGSFSRLDQSSKNFHDLMGKVKSEEF
ncbi:ABC-type multidrug transport system, ATPase and permease component [Dyadobacter koreensis]|uniref:ABC-type multidrug transport system, ATPase and permease component n=1 Tax=Dyadobacter koreensis TaxID=408657 RepID=A0A1H6QCZ7_9BACT|nr:ABC transporter ATP-binding protein [Dyadobacter koreensis]SEI37420.1 ABC-type multidrug transport system, ATPase and permease component [Dyadobacter koreensis]